MHRIKALGVAGAGLAAVCGLIAPPAEAQTRRRPEPARVARAAPAPVRPAAPLLLVVAIAEQRVTVYAGTEQIATAPISTGQTGHRTPTGVFSIIQKNRYHESNIYSGAPMPYMQRITWSGIALHEGNLPGYPASHGCIRMPGAFASQLFAMTRLGARVVVAANAVAPAQFAHPRLPEPAMQPADTSTASLPGTPLLLASANGDGAAAPPRLLNPMEFAEHDKRRAALAAGDAARIAKAALETATKASADAALAAERGRERQAAIAPYRDLVATAERARRAATSEEDRVQAEASLATAEEAVADAVADAAAAKQAEGAASDAAFAAARVARESGARAEAAEAAGRQAQRATEPITVFVSRKDNRVVVRQGFEPLFDGEVKIADPQWPLGTHVFTATSAGLRADGTPEVRWSALPVPDAGHGRDSHARVLDRIEFTADVSARIAKRLWTGATLIVSDNGVSTETGKGTDVVVQTK